MGQHTWIITFNNISDVDANRYASELRGFLLDLDVIPNIKVDQKRSDNDTQNLGDTIVAILGTSAVSAVVSTIALWIKGHYGASIDIEIENIKLKAQNITNKNCDSILNELLKYIQENNNEEK
jgi:hypothetical protein